MKKFLSITAAILVALAILAGSLGLLPQATATEAQAAPPAAVTPLTFVARNTVVTQGFTTNAFEVADYTTLFLQHAIQQAAITNATTITFQRSVNGWEWIDGPVLAEASATEEATVSAITTYTVAERYGRIQVGLANTTPVTLNVVGAAKP
jgi:hypothetical protein